MKYYVYLNEKEILKSSEHLFAVQLARECYIDQGYAAESLTIRDDDGNLMKNHAND